MIEEEQEWRRALLTGFAARARDEVDHPGREALLEHLHGRDVGCQDRPCRAAERPRSVRGACRRMAYGVAPGGISTGRGVEGVDRRLRALLARVHGNLPT